MGLMDVLRGMSNGPRGQTTSGQGGGMSPITMGLLALLAYKTLKGGGPLGNIFGQGSPAGTNAGGRDATPSGPSPGQSAGSGGLMDWLGSGLGGALAGGAAGSILTNGLSELVRQFQQNGHGDAAHSWVGTGPNQAISPGDLERAAGTDTLDALAQQTGLPRDRLLQDLSAELPGTVDQLTPHGRIPSEEEASKWV
jgi:uncharacterized protein YidB (DUF937 family)